MKKIIALTLTILSITTFAKKERVSLMDRLLIQKSLECSRNVLFNHKGTLVQLREVAELLDMIDTREVPNDPDYIDSLRSAFGICRNLKKNKIGKLSMEEKNEFIEGLAETDMRSSVIDLTSSLVYGVDDYVRHQGLEDMRAYLFEK